MSETLNSNEVAHEWWGLIDYEVALKRMVSAHASRVVGSRDDGFFYLEHPAIITYGRATPESDLKTGTVPLIEVPRGGLATYHAPGQMVGYIVLDLSRRADNRKPDIHAYLRALEAGIIHFLRIEFSLESCRREGFTGVWTVPEAGENHGRKLASIGVSARRWVTSHGFALNICPDMSGFDQIVPCGITDATMTSVEKEYAKRGQSLAIKPMEAWSAIAHGYLVNALRDEGWLF